MILIDQLRTSNLKYSPTIVRDLIDSNRAKYGYVKPVTNKMIFFMMKRIVLRGATAFINIIKNKPGETQFDIEDAVTELYMVLDKCTKNYDTKQGKDFYLYFNTAVSRRISRIAGYSRMKKGEVAFSKVSKYTDDENGFTIEDMVEGTCEMHEVSDTLLWEDIGKLNLTTDQQRLIQMVYSTDKTKDILKEMGLTRGEYRQEMSEIQTIIKDTYL